jgi:hypothetical protein
MSDHVYLSPMALLVLVASLIAAGIAIGGAMAPEIQRYLKMRSM